MAILSCSNLSMTYENTLALSHVSFSVEEGEYLCIVGENGSGKSTLLKGLLHLMSPKEGTIRYREDIRSNEIGYLPQQTAVQRDFPASVLEVVLSGCLNRRGLFPFYSNKEKKRAQDNMELLGIWDMAKICYRNLSSGQQQRVLLARALCATQKILILDEPTTGLDPLVTAEFYGLIKKLNREIGITVVMVSHDIHGILPDADKILHIHTGVLFWGTAEDYKNSPIGQRFFGGHPHA